MNNIKLLNKDCIEVMSAMAEKGFKVDCIITDPPYELDVKGGGGILDTKKIDILKDKEIAYISEGFDYEKCFELFLKIQKTPNIIVFCSNKQLYKFLKFFNERNLNTTVLVWKKLNPPPLCNNKHVNDLEYLVYVRGKGATFNNSVPSSYKHKCYMSNLVISKDKIHPTQKNLEHLERLVSLHSLENQVVFDPFMGSGTTGVACKNLNRKFIGCEIDMKMFEKAKERLENLNNAE